VIATVHLADVGPRRALAVLRSEPDPSEVPGLHYARVTARTLLISSLLPHPSPGRVGLIATWEDDQAFEEFSAHHPLASQLAHGWQVRLQPTRIVGAWPAMGSLVTEEIPMDDEEPAAIMTFGRLRLSQGARFLRASAGAEGSAVRSPALLASTGLARPPALVATFSLWSSTAAMRAYVTGGSAPGHLAALRANSARPFHHESAFIRFRPYASKGEWGGRDPLADQMLTPRIPASS
jgi:hypothetical protein